MALESKEKEREMKKITFGSEKGRITERERETEKDRELAFKQSAPKNLLPLIKGEERTVVPKAENNRYHPSVWSCRGGPLPSSDLNR